MKFQKLLYTKFKTGAGTTVAYQNFAKSTGDGKKGSPLGDYGKTTADLIQLIKEGLDKPVWQEEDGSRGNGNTITVNFVKRIQDEIAQGKIRESREPLTYLGLDGNSIIINEDWGVPSTAAKVSTTPAAKPKAKTSANTSSSSNLPSTGEISYPGDPGWKYKLISGKWNCRKDSETKWSLLISPSWIKKLIAFTGQGNYINLTKSTNGYTSNSDTALYNYKDGAWQILMNNSWMKVPDPSFLVKLYGATPTSTAPVVTSLKAENKRIMDLVAAYGAGKKEVDNKGSGSSRIIQFHFKPSDYSASYRDYWNISFYENGDGQSRKSTFSIYDNYNDKVIYRGYLENFSGNKFKLRTTIGVVIGTFNDTLENLLKRLCDAGDDIFWYS
jgi:hypothetical protein